VVVRGWCHGLGAARGGVWRGGEGCEAEGEGEVEAGRVDVRGSGAEMRCRRRAGG